MKNQRGFSALELFVWVGIFIVMIPIMVAILRSTIFSSHQLVKSNLTNVEKTRSINSFLGDLRSASRGALGNTQCNGGFEEYDELTGAPLFWPMAVTGNGESTYIDSYPNNQVRSGFKSVGLRTFDAGGVSIQSGHEIRLSSGAAYMLVAQVHRTEINNNGRLELLDALTNLPVTTVASTSDGWNKIMIRYPAVGLIDFAIHPKRVKIQLSVNAPGPLFNEWVYFDDIALIPIHSILAPASVSNVQNLSINDLDLTETSGFRFSKWENGRMMPFRYRVMDGPLGATLIREKFDGRWKLMNGKLIPGLTSLEFSFNELGVLPPLGYDTPLTINVGFKNYSKRNPLGEERIETMMVYAAAP